MKYFTHPILALVIILICSCGRNTKGENSIKNNTDNRDVAIIKGTKINIREKATIDSKVLGLLNNGDEVFIIETGIAGKSQEATLKKNTDFVYEGTNEFAMTVNKGRAVKILSDNGNEYDVFLYMRGKKVLATVLPGDLDLLEGEAWMKFETKNGITGYCLEKYTKRTGNKTGEGNPTNDEKKTVEIYKSDDLGLVEYMKKVKYTDDSYDWFYYTDKKPEPVKMGITEKNGFEAVYFSNKPNVVYEIGEERCGFTVTDPKATSQWYEQVSPPCN